MRGRKQTPTTLKLVRGNPGRRPINQEEPKPPTSSTVPECPDGIGDHGRAFWSQQAPLHHVMGTLTEVDGPAFVALTEAWNEYRELTDDIRAKGRTHLTPNNGNSARPEIAMRKQALADWIKLASEFGLTPAARARIQANPPDGHSDPIKDFQASRPKRA